MLRLTSSLKLTGNMYTFKSNSGFNLRTIKSSFNLDLKRFPIWALVVAQDPFADYIKLDV